MKARRGSAWRGGRWGTGALVALAILLGAARAWARAGGGEHYGGSSSHSSGGGYSGGGGGGGGNVIDLFNIVVLLVQLTWDHPVVMVPLWVVVLLIARAWLQAQTGGPARPIQRLERSRLNFPSPGPALQQISTRDPSFDLDAFRARTRTVFHAIQEAWFLRQLPKSRQLMSDGLFRRFTTLETIMRLEGRRDALADDQVKNARIVTATTTEAFDIVTVRLDASMRDTDVPSDTTDEKARAAAKKQPSDSFTELWTFVRRPGAKTREGFDLGQGKCPNCGADFTGGMANTCEYCKAIVNSGNYDWVLTEITQEDEFLPPARGAPGMDGLHARDPNAAPEVLEDRALLLFWKWLETFAADDPGVLRKLARPEMLAQVAGVLSRMKAKGVSPVVKVPAVGGADVAAVEVDDGGWDRVHVDVRWSGTVALDPDDALGRLAQRPRRHVVQMVRRTGAKTSPGTGVATERCGNCSAPLSDSDSTACEYCGHDLAGGETDWTLERVVAYESWQRPSVAASGAVAAASRAFATSGERTRLLQMLTALAKADGVVDEAERRMLRDCSKRWGVPWDKVALMLEGEANLPLDGLESMSPDQARIVLGELVRMVRVDGRVDRRERALLGEAAERMDVSVQELEGMLG